MELLPISTPHCRIERDGHVVVVTMDRPEARNALSTDMLVGLAEAWAYISAEPEVRVGILTGASGTFCAGADLKAMGSPSEDPRVRQRASEIADFHWKGLLRGDAFGGVGGGQSRQRVAGARGRGLGQQGAQVGEGPGGATERDAMGGHQRPELTAHPVRAG